MGNPACLTSPIPVYTVGSGPLYRAADRGVSMGDETQAPSMTGSDRNTIVPGVNEGIPA